MGSGKILLTDGSRRSYEISKDISSFAVVVDLFDLEAEALYEKFDFIKLPYSGKMVLAMATLKNFSNKNCLHRP